MMRAMGLGVVLLATASCTDEHYFGNTPSLGILAPGDEKSICVPDESVALPSISVLSANSTVEDDATMGRPEIQIDDMGNFKKAELMVNGTVVQRGISLPDLADNGFGKNLDMRWGDAMMVNRNCALQDFDVQVRFDDGCGAMTDSNMEQVRLGSPGIAMQAFASGLPAPFDAPSETKPLIVRQGRELIADLFGALYSLPNQGDYASFDVLITNDSDSTIQTEVNGISYADLQALLNDRTWNEPEGSQTVTISADSNGCSEGIQFSTEVTRCDSIPDLELITAPGTVPAGQTATTRVRVRNTNGFGAICNETYEIVALSVDPSLTVNTVTSPARNGGQAIGVDVEIQTTVPVTTDITLVARAISTGAQSVPLTIPVRADNCGRNPGIRIVGSAPTTVAELEPVPFSIEVTNNDDASCGPSNIQVNMTATTKFAPVSQTANNLSPGASATINFSPSPQNVGAPTASTLTFASGGTSLDHTLTIEPCGTDPGLQFRSTSLTQVNEGQSTTFGIRVTNNDHAVCGSRSISVNMSSTPGGFSGTRSRSIGAGSSRDVNFTQGAPQVTNHTTYDLDFTSGGSLVEHSLEVRNVPCSNTALNLSLQAGQNARMPTTAGGSVNFGVRAWAGSNGCAGNFTITENRGWGSTTNLNIPSDGNFRDQVLNFSVPSGTPAGIYPVTLTLTRDGTSHVSSLNVEIEVQNTCTAQDIEATLTSAPGAPFPIVGNEATLDEGQTLSHIRLNVTNNKCSTKSITVDGAVGGGPTLADSSITRSSMAAGETRHFDFTLNTSVGDGQANAYWVVFTIGETGKEHEDTEILVVNIVDTTPGPNCRGNEILAPAGGCRANQGWVNGSEGCCKPRNCANWGMADQGHAWSNAGGGCPADTHRVAHCCKWDEYFIGTQCVNSYNGDAPMAGYEAPYPDILSGNVEIHEVACNPSYSRECTPEHPGEGGALTGVAEWHYYKRVLISSGIDGEDLGWYGEGFDGIFPVMCR